MIKSSLLKCKNCKYWDGTHYGAYDKPIDVGFCNYADYFEPKPLMELTDPGGLKTVANFFCAVWDWNGEHND